MGRRCKCKLCGAELNTDTAYRGTTDKGCQFYCCSESEYNADLMDKAARINVIEYTYQIIGRTDNGALYKEIEAWHKFSSWRKIEHYLEQNVDYINSQMNGKTFSNIYNKIRYMSAIVKNSIDDFKEQTAPVIEKQSNELIPVKERVTPKPKRRGLAYIDV